MFYSIPLLLVTQILKKLMAALALSRRQYYDRINDLRTAGLIERHKGRYEVTSFGRIVYSLLGVIRKASDIEIRQILPP